MEKCQQAVGGVDGGRRGDEILGPRVRVHYAVVQVEGQGDCVIVNGRPSSLRFKHGSLTSRLERSEATKKKSVITARENSVPPKPFIPRTSWVRPSLEKATSANRPVTSHGQTGYETCRATGEAKERVARQENKTMER